MRCRDNPVIIDEAEVAGLLAVAYPDRIARLRDGSDLQYQLANGMAAALDTDSPLRGAKYLVVVDLYARTRAEVRISLSVRFSRDGFAQIVGRTTEWQRRVEWDAVRKQVQAQEVRVYGALVLQSRPVKAEPEDARAALLDWVAKKGLDTLTWSKEAQQLRERLRFVSELLSAQGWPDYSDAGLLRALAEWLGPYLNAVRSVEQLRRVDLQQALLSQLDWSNKKELDRLAPERIKVPGGSNVRIDYSGAQPVLAVKLQELFGLADSPRIAAGKVPVLIHLLSPAGRPLQVTADLKSFWENGYPEVKKEMKGRYPKHPWPDDPWSAVPTKKTNRKRK